MWLRYRPPPVTAAASSCWSPTRAPPLLPGRPTPAGTGSPPYSIAYLVGIHLNRSLNRRYVNVLARLLDYVSPP
jgi:hypothetical protein